MLFVVVAAALFHGFLEFGVMGFQQIGTRLALGLLIGFPMIISTIIVPKLEFNISVMILLVSTIAFGIWTIYAWYMQIFIYRSSPGIYLIPIFAIPVMLPAWVAALLLNGLYAGKAAFPP
jgi:uncharacterized protein with PQ loop repeat